MTTIMMRFGCALLVLGAMRYGFAQQTTSAGSEREKDTYAIYSLLLTNPETSHGADNNERYLIAPTTVSGIPAIPCVRPPNERAGDFAEVWADYQRQKAIPRELKPMLSIQKPYVLLSDDEVKDFIKERLPQRVSESPDDERFRGSIDLFKFTDVYFNSKRTLALVQMSSWCGPLCGLWKWKVFEKVDGTWEPRQWVTCATIS